MNRDILWSVFKYISNKTDLWNILCVCKLWRDVGMNSMSYQAMMTPKRKDDFFIQPITLLLKSNGVYEFFLACSHGDLIVAKWICHVFRLTKKKVCSVYEICGFELACKNGHFHVVRWMTKKFQLTKNDLRWSYNKKFYNKPFYYGCSSGNLEMVQWLYSTFCLTKDDIEGCYVSACENGHLKIVEWLYTIPSFTKEDIIYDNGFRFACANGHLNVAQWLHKTFILPLNIIDLKYELPFSEACSGGHLEVVRWLSKTFELLPKYFRPCSLSFYWACDHGYLSIVKWLYKKHQKLSNCNDPDDQISLQRILDCTCLKGHVHVLQWLCDTFYSSGSIPMNYHKNLGNCCQLGNIKMVQWLCQHFLFTEKDICSEKTHAFVNAYISKHFDVAKWLYENFQFTYHDACRAVFNFDNKRRQLDKLEFQKYISSDLRIMFGCHNISDRLIALTDHIMAFTFYTPIVLGHILLCPIRNIIKFEDLTYKERRELFVYMRKLKNVLKTVFGAEGFHIAWNEGELAGQMVPHFHIHIVPRKKDDGITGYELYRSKNVSPKEELEVAKKIRDELERY